MLKIVAISDTHNQHRKLKIPECDLLIHAGDWSSMGTDKEVIDFCQWLDTLEQVKNAVVIPGNHELYFEKNLPTSLAFFKYYCPWINLLIDQGVEIEGVKIWGSPVTPFFCDWAWNRSSGTTGGYYQNMKSYFPPPIKPHWDMIPNDTNILITHGPPYGILDETTYSTGEPKPGHLGCSELMSRIKELKDLDLHFFGHIHSPGGRQEHKDGVSFYNAACCDEMYCITNPLTIVEYER